jgi:hypothetical protein
LGGMVNPLITDPCSPPPPRADIQRPILAWIVILSVYGADTIATDLFLSDLLIYEINYWVFKQF